MAALAEHRVRTAEADHADARRAEAEGLFTSIGAHDPSNHRRLLSLPEGVALLLDQIEELRNHLRVGSAWTGAHADAFDHLTGRRYSPPLTRMAALTNLIRRDDASALAPAEAPADDRAARWAWATAEVAQLVDAELTRLRGLRAAVSDDKASLLTRKSMFAAHRAFLQTHEAIRRLRRDEARQAGPPATAELRADLAWNEPNPTPCPPSP